MLTSPREIIQGTRPLQLKKKTAVGRRNWGKRLEWQGTDPELFLYRLVRKKQENLQASVQVLKASKADGRKHSGSSYNSLTGLAKWHHLPQVWEWDLRILQPFTLVCCEAACFIADWASRERRHSAFGTDTPAKQSMNQNIFLARKREGSIWICCSLLFFNAMCVHRVSQRFLPQLAGLQFHKYRGPEAHLH